MLKAFQSRFRRFEGRIRRQTAARLSLLYEKYKTYTMVSEGSFQDNLRLCSELAGKSGSVVECGVWRGGMAAAMAEVLGSGRHYYLFDSFEGLPEAKAIDGTAALEWQADKTSAMYYDNCKTEMRFAREAMRLAGDPPHSLHRGWFRETLPAFAPEEPILVLRLDADWYGSTFECLSALYGDVQDGGLILIDDYYTWDGCTRAVHDFFSRKGLPERVRQTRHGVAYILKNSRGKYGSPKQCVRI